MLHIRLATEVGASTRIHHVDTPLDVVRSRLERRNVALPRYNFHVDPATLGVFMEMFQRPSDDDGADVTRLAPPDAS
jgi:predicted kinase